MTTPAAQYTLVRTLPGRYYFDPEIYRLEEERIFSQLWFCVGRADAIPNPGDFLTCDVTGENLLIVRSRSGAVQAFLNVCRHRGARLCAELQGSLRGGVIQCRYHAWSYNLEGQLIGAPNMRDLPGFERESFGLHRVPLEVWEGLLWVNLASQPEPIEAQLDRAIVERFGERETFSRYRIGTLGVGQTIVYDVAANWKLIVENFMECYHCAVVHPELSSLVPSFREGLAYQQGIGARFADGVESLTVTGKTTRPLLPGLLPQDERTYYGIVLLPNVFVNLHPDYVLIHRLEPKGPGRTLIVCDWLFDPPVIEQPGFDPSDAVEFWDLVNRQDWEACELCQANVDSRAYREGGIYAPTEAHIRRFNDFVLARLEGTGA